MAAVLIVRALIRLDPHVGVRVVQWASGPGVATASGLSSRLWHRLSDPFESDADLEVAVSGATGTVAAVATFTGTFELRKAQVLYGRAGGSAGGDDDAVTTMHLLKLSGGSPDADWTEANFLAAEAAIIGFWDALKSTTPSIITCKEIRWYRTGPQRDIELGAPGRTGPPVRVRSVGTAGGATANNGTTLPPQCAISVTERTSDRKSWGRFYQPALFNLAYNGQGRLLSANQTTVANAADTMYEAFLAASLPAVVYAPALPERPTKGGGTLPARSARALTVDTVQVDDIVDIIRSRRWDVPVLKLQRAIG